MKLHGIVKHRRQLAELAKKYGGKPVAVEVGYSAPYALYVHENTEMKLAGEPRPSGIGVYWGPHGQAKFLEQPMREMMRAGIFIDIIKAKLKEGSTLAQAIFAAGQALQESSQELVPVEYGELKASAFTRISK